MARNGFKFNGFPLAYASTQNFSLGAPRGFVISADGRRVFFLRSISSRSKYLELWCNFNSDPKYLNRTFRLVGANDIGELGFNEMPEPERVRRERARERAVGITSFSTDPAGTTVVFSVQGVLHLYDVDQRALVRTGETRVTAPRLSPNAQMVSFVRERELFVDAVKRKPLRLARSRRRISPIAKPQKTWGLPEFVAAEEMHRFDGYWWSPRSDGIIFQETDERDVPQWSVTDLTSPAATPRSYHYPHAGSPNARVSLHWWSRGSVSKRVYNFPATAPYLVGVQWNRGAPILTVQDRQQKSVDLLRLDIRRRRAVRIHSRRDPKWVDLVPGLPTFDAHDDLIDASDRSLRGIEIAGAPVPGIRGEVRKYVGQLTSGGLIYLASEDPKETHVWLREPESAPRRLTTVAGVFDARVGGNTVAIWGTTLGRRPHLSRVLQLIPGRRSIRNLPCKSAPLQQTPRPLFLKSDRNGIEYALLLPNHAPRGTNFPVIMDPYAGPGAQRVLRSSPTFSVSQWLAAQGFAVIVADGRGTPGRGPRWEKAVAGNLARHAVFDQIEALDDAAAKGFPIDLDRVGIKGWSYGGYLALMAVLTRPDRFHAAVAGAPVTDWRNYDTHFSERYLGDPRNSSRSYDESSAVALARRLERPLLLIHGLMDDNVHCVHTMQLHSALVEQGRDHKLLLLQNLTHIVESEKIGQELLQAQMVFLQKSLLD